MIARRKGGDEDAATQRGVLNASNPWNIILDDDNLWVTMVTGEYDKKYRCILLEPSFDRFLVMANHSHICARVLYHKDFRWDKDSHQHRGILWHFLGTYCGSPVHYFEAGNAVLDSNSEATAFDCCQHM